MSALVKATKKDVALLSKMKNFKKKHAYLKWYLAEKTNEAEKFVLEAKF